MSRFDAETQVVLHLQRRRLARLGAVGTLALVSAACGYQSVAGAGTDWKVALHEVRAPHPDAAQAARTGLIDAVSEAAPQPGATVQLDLLRVDEVASGARAAGNTVRATGSLVRVTVRAQLLSKTGKLLRDSGDISRTEALGDRLGAEDHLGFQQAVRVAARRAGHAAGRRLLGNAVPEDELL